MNSVLVRPFSAVFADVPDWRQAKGRRHLLPVILNLVVVALINQQNSLRQIASWAQGLDRQTRARLQFRHGRPPSFETIRRTLKGIDTVALAAAIQQWMEEVLSSLPIPNLQALAIDGKTLRGSGDEDNATRALQVLNVLVHQLGVIITSQAVPPGTNEIGAAKQLLEELVLTGRIVTMDALFTQQELAQSILEKGGTT